MFASLDPAVQKKVFNERLKIARSACRASRSFLSYLIMIHEPTTMIIIAIGMFCTNSEENR